MGFWKYRTPVQCLITTMSKLTVTSNSSRFCPPHYSKVQLTDKKYLYILKKKKSLAGQKNLRLRGLQLGNATDVRMKTLCGQELK